MTFSQSNGLRVNFGITKFMVGRGSTKDGLSNGKVDPCSLRVRVIADLCLQCGNWIHDSCAGIKRVPKIFRTFFLQKM